MKQGEPDFLVLEYVTITKDVPAGAGSGVPPTSSWTSPDASPRTHGRLSTSAT